MCLCVFFLLCVCVCVSHMCACFGLSAILSVHFYYQRPFFTVRNTITFSFRCGCSHTWWQWHRPACEYSSDIDQPVNTAVCQPTLDDTWWFRPHLHTAYSLWHSDWLKLFGRWVALKLLWPTCYPRASFKTQNFVWELLEDLPFFSFFEKWC